MAVTQSPRMEQTRWSSPDDPFTRDQLDDDHAKVEALAAGYMIDVAANRPAPGPTNVGFVFFASDRREFTFSTGAEWLELGGGGSWARSFLTMGA